MGKWEMPVDTGYSWVVCIAVSVIFVFDFGMVKSLGIVLMEIQEEFQSDPSLTSLTVSLILAGFFMFVFFANTAGLLVGFRKVAIAAAFLSFLSMFLTFFAPNIYYVIIVLGLLSGIAYSGLFGPCLIILTPYFQKRRALATGMAMAGASIGQLVIPFVFSTFVSVFTFRGGILLFSALMLHLIPAAMLLRPAETWKRPREQKRLREAAKEVPMCTKFKKVMKQMMDKDLLCSGLFYHYLAAIITGHCGYFCCMVFLPTMARTVFNSKTMSVLLISIIGVGDLIGRLLGGWVSDLGIIPINMVMAISLGLPGVVTIMCALFPSVWIVWLTAIFIGMFAGSYVALITPSIVTFFGLEKVPAGFGIVAFLMGAAIVPLPALLAGLYKQTGRMDEVILICGILLSIGGALFALLSLTVKLRGTSGKDAAAKGSDYSKAATEERAMDVETAVAPLETELKDMKDTWGDSDEEVSVAPLNGERDTNFNSQKA